MTTYISLLRGINVSGQKMIKMEELRAEYEALGFSHIKSYIQSGNVIFQTASQDKQDIATKIQAKILERWGFEVPVMLKTKEEWLQALNSNPFILERKEDKSKLHLTFLSEVPKPENIAKVRAGDYGADEFILLEKSLYLFCPNGYGNSKLTNTFWENKWKVQATTRNWNTMEKIADLVGNG